MPYEYIFRVSARNFERGGPKGVGEYGGTPPGEKKSEFLSFRA